MSTSKSGKGMTCKIIKISNAKAHATIVENKEAFFMMTFLVGLFGKLK